MRHLRSFSPRSVSPRSSSPRPSLACVIRSLVAATFCYALALTICGSAGAQAQSASKSSVVPQLVSFSGKATDVEGKVFSGVAGVTFAIYKDQYEGAPLWIETQSVSVDSKGNYSVQLGATKPEGLPVELFASGEARWLGVRINGAGEQPRVLLLSVPYALKAADAQTLGGLPASAFVLAAPSSTASPGAASAPSSNSVTPANAAVTGLGTVNSVPLWDTTSDIVSSAIFQTGSGTAAKIGINTATPVSALDIKGGETVRGALNLATTGIATATAGKSSQPLVLSASVYNRAVGAAASQNFRWQAEPAGNDTASASGTLNLLYGAGSNAPVETGLHIASNGQIKFAAGQAFPGTGSITSVTAGTDLTGGGNSGSITLNLDTTKVPQLNSTNSFTADQTFQNINAFEITANNLTAASVTVNSSGSGAGVLGNNTYATGGAGVWGYTVGHSGKSYGVYGQYISEGGFGAGVYGQAAGSTSTTGSSFNGGFGVWADAGGQQQTGNIALLATADSGIAGDFHNNGTQYTISATNHGSGGPFLAVTSQGAGCWIDSAGTLHCTNQTLSVPLSSGQRKVDLAAIGSPKNWFEDFGSEQLTNGVAVVRLDSDFAQTVNTGVEYHVFLTPNGDCKGLYVAQKSPTSFEVRELGGGTTSARFDYRIVALRRNFEKIRMADHTYDLENVLAPTKMQEHRSDSKAPNSVSTLLRPGRAPTMDQK
jgi:hypothetical protein